MERINHPTAVDIGGKMSFRSKDTVAGVPGTVVTATHLNAQQEEVVGLIEAAGLVPSGTDTNQATRAIRRGKLNYAVAGGTANALTATLGLAPEAGEIADGFRLFLNITTTNTAAATLDAGDGVKAFTRRDGTALQPEDLVAGVIYPVIRSGAGYRLLVPGSAEIPRVLAANATIYVRTDGNDANDGSANTAGAALLTIQAAIDRAIRRFVLAGRSVTIQLGNAGTYAAFSVPPTPGSLIIQGDVANQANYIVSGTGAGGLSGVFGVTGASVKIAGVTLRNGANNTNTLAAVGGATIQLDRVTLDAIGTIGWSHLLALPNSSIQIVGNITIGAQQHAVTFDAQGGNIEASNVTCQFSAPVVSTAVARATNVGRISMFSTVQGGSVFSGKRYAADLNSVINTFGGGANYFLGSIAGTTATGAQYA